MTSLFYVAFVSVQVPVTLDPAVWYSTPGLVIIAPIVALAIYAFRTSQGTLAPDTTGGAR